MTKKPTANAGTSQGLLRGAQAVLDTMQLGVTQANADGDILYANPAVAEMHGYSVDELVGSNVSLFSGSGVDETTMDDRSDERTSWASERVHKRKDGSTLVVRVGRSSPVTKTSRSAEGKRKRFMSVTRGSLSTPHYTIRSPAYRTSSCCMTWSGTPWVAAIAVTVTCSRCWSSTSIVFTWSTMVSDTRWGISS
jgi:PAS domain S-box-containing protein